MRITKIYANDFDTKYEYYNEADVRENFICDMLDITMLGGIYDIHEVVNDQWVSFRERVEAEKYDDGTPLENSAKEVWLKELIADRLYDLKEIADAEEEQVVIQD